MGFAWAFANFTHGVKYGMLFGVSKLLEKKTKQARCSIVWTGIWDILPQPTPTRSKSVLSIFLHAKEYKAGKTSEVGHTRRAHGNRYNYLTMNAVHVQHTALDISNHPHMDLRRNNPGTLSSPSFGKWDMVSNSNLQSGDFHLGHM